MIASEPLPHFVDDLLSYLYETHPTHATLDGVHTHDDLLEDVSRHGIDSEAHALAGYLRRLDEINRDALTGIERLEHRMLTAHLQARMFELEAVRTWERNPQFYSDLLATSLAGQTLFTHAPAAERARRVLSKLRQTPRLIQAARDNIKDPPGIFVKVGIETMRGALKFIDEDLPRAFADVDDLHLLGDLADAQTEAAHAVGQYVEYLETDLAPKARASFRLGRDKFEQKLRLDEGVTLPIDRLLAIATRELQATQEEFRSLAGKMNGGDAMAVWAKTKAQHPGPGAVGRLRPAAARRARDVSGAAEHHHAAAGRADRGRADTRLLPVVVRQHVDARPVREQADARVLLPDRRRSVMAGGAPGRAPARLQPTRRCGRSRFTKFIRDTSCTIST